MPAAKVRRPLPTRAWGHSQGAQSPNVGGYNGTILKAVWRLQDLAGPDVRAGLGLSLTSQEGERGRKAMGTASDGKEGSVGVRAPAGVI